MQEERMKNCDSWSWRLFPGQGRPCFHGSKATRSLCGSSAHISIHRPGCCGFFFFPKDFHSFRRQAFFFLLPLAVVEKPQRPLGPHGIVLSHAAPASRTRDGISSDSRAGRAENTEHEEEKSRCWSTEENIFRPVAWRINHCLQWRELSGCRSWSPVLVSSSHNCDWLIRFNSGSKKVVSKSARAILKLSHLKRSRRDRSSSFSEEKVQNSFPLSPYKKVTQSASQQKVI